MFTIAKFTGIFFLTIGTAFNVPLSNRKSDFTSTITTKSTTASVYFTGNNGSWTNSTVSVEVGYNLYSSGANVYKRSTSGTETLINTFTLNENYILDNIYISNTTVGTSGSTVVANTSQIMQYATVYFTGNNGSWTNSTVSIEVGYNLYSSGANVYKRSTSGTDTLINTFNLNENYILDNIYISNTTVGTSGSTVVANTSQIIQYATVYFTGNNGSWTNSTVSVEVGYNLYSSGANVYKRSTSGTDTLINTFTPTEGYRLDSISISNTTVGNSGSNVVAQTINIIQYATVYFTGNNGSWTNSTVSVEVGYNLYSTGANVYKRSTTGTDTLINTFTANTGYTFDYIYIATSTVANSGSTVVGYTQQNQSTLDKTIAYTNTSTSYNWTLTNYSQSTKNIYYNILTIIQFNNISTIEDIQNKTYTTLSPSSGIELSSYINGTKYILIKYDKNYDIFGDNVYTTTNPTTQLISNISDSNYNYIFIKVSQNANNDHNFYTIKLTGTNYNITQNLSNLTSSNTSQTIQRDATFTTTLSADNGYNLPSNVVINGTYSYYTYSYQTGVLNIYNVNSDITITATAIYPIITNNTFHLYTVNFEAELKEFYLGDSNNIYLSYSNGLTNNTTISNKYNLTSDNILSIPMKKLKNNTNNYYLYLRYVPSTTRTYSRFKADIKYYDKISNTIKTTSVYLQNEFNELDLVNNNILKTTNINPDIIPYITEIIIYPPIDLPDQPGNAKTLLSLLDTFLNLRIANITLVSLLLIVITLWFIRWLNKI